MRRCSGNCSCWHPQGSTRMFSKLLKVKSDKRVDPLHPRQFPELADISLFSTTCFSGGCGRPVELCWNLLSQSARGSYVFIYILIRPNSAHSLALRFYRLLNRLPLFSSLPSGAVLTEIDSLTSFQRIGGSADINDAVAQVRRRNGGMPCSVWLTYPKMFGATTSVRREIH